MKKINQNITVNIININLDKETVQQLKDWFKKIGTILLL